MENDKLSDRERALLAEARREAAARKLAPAAAAEPAKAAPTQAERLAQLMADERAETLQRKKRMRRYGLAISGAILALFALWLARAFRPRR
jgi:hypothetical protein